MEPGFKQNAARSKNTMRIVMRFIRQSCALSIFCAMIMAPVATTYADPSKVTQKSLKIVGDSVVKSQWWVKMTRSKVWRKWEGKIDKIVPSQKTVWLILGTGAVLFLGKAIMGKIFFRKERKGSDGGEVSIGVVAPAEVECNEDVLIQIVGARIDGFSNAVCLAQSFDEENNAKLRGVLSLNNLEMNTNLIFRLSIRGLQIRDLELSHVWDGANFMLQYSVHIDENCAHGAKNAELVVWGDDRPLGKIVFVVNVKDRKSMNAAIRANTSAHAYRHYFISYSDIDFPAVADRIQGLQLAEREIEQHMFFDKLFLKPGERYEPIIYDYIDNRADVFLLFWSRQAKLSEWVRKEYMRALECQGKRHGLPDIIPVPIELPIPQPPEELAHLHFNDRLMLVKEGNRHLQPSAKPL